MTKFKATGLLFATLLIQSASFATEGNPPSDHTGGDVVGTYPSGDKEPAETSRALDIARMKMAGNETVPGTETGSRGAAGVFLGLAVFLSIGFGIYRLIGVRSHQPKVS